MSNDKSERGPGGGLVSREIAELENAIDLAKIEADKLRAMYAAATIALRIDVPIGLTFEPDEENCDGSATLFCGEEALGAVDVHGRWWVEISDVRTVTTTDGQALIDLAAAALLAHLVSTGAIPQLDAIDAEVARLTALTRRLRADLEDARLGERVAARVALGEYADMSLVPDDTETSI